MRLYGAAKYDFGDAPIRSVYPSVSEYVNGARPAGEVSADIERFLTAEDRLYDELKLTPAKTLTSLEYEVAGPGPHSRPRPRVHSSAQPEPFLSLWSFGVLSLKPHTQPISRKVLRLR